MPALTQAPDAAAVLTEPVSRAELETLGLAHLVPERPTRARLQTVLHELRTAAARRQQALTVESERRILGRYERRALAWPSSLATLEAPPPTVGGWVERHVQELERRLSHAWMVVGQPVPPRWQRAWWLAILPALVVPFVAWSTNWLLGLAAAFAFLGGVALGGLALFIPTIAAAASAIAFRWVGQAPPTVALGFLLFATVVLLAVVWYDQRSIRTEDHVRAAAQSNAQQLLDEEAVLVETLRRDLDALEQQPVNAFDPADGPYPAFLAQVARIRPGIAERLGLLGMRSRAHAALYAAIAEAVPNGTSDPEIVQQAVRVLADPATGFDRWYAQQRARGILPWGPDFLEEPAVRSLLTLLRARGASRFAAGQDLLAEAPARAFHSTAAVDHAHDADDEREDGPPRRPGRFGLIG